MINILNKCSNIEEIAFNRINDSKKFFNILENINCSKIKIIYASLDEIDSNYDWNIILEKNPLLEELSIEELNNINMSYMIRPIFTKGNKKISFPFLEHLIRNYLNGSPDRDIELFFYKEFDEFWDYFKNKKDIISRIRNCKVIALIFHLILILKLHLMNMMI